MRAEPEYRQCSDNHAHVCLDAAWLLFLTGDMTNLPQAKRLLACAAQGFEHSHGADLGRLRALKGENCAEYALYARLHLLQGIVAYLSGDEGHAGVLLLRATEECNRLAVKSKDVRQLQVREQSPPLEHYALTEDFDYSNMPEATLTNYTLRIDRSYSLEVHSDQAAPSCLTAVRSILLPLQLFHLLQQSELERVNASSENAVPNFAAPSTDSVVCCYCIHNRFNDAVMMCVYRLTETKA
eukprot:7226-Heterococcus_DN1.PRE.1